MLRVREDCQSRLYEVVSVAGSFVMRLYFAMISALVMLSIFGALLLSGGFWVVVSYGSVVLWFKEVVVTVRQKIPERQCVLV